MDEPIYSFGSDLRTKGKIVNKKIISAGLLTLALTLSACGGAGSENGAAKSDKDRSYDVSAIQKDETIAAKLPEKIKNNGKLVIGAAIDYAPAEFRADDLQTGIGYDVDLGKALGKVLGVETELSAAEFASLLPGMGTKYDLGISSFTVSQERTDAYNMIAYIKVGSSYAVQKGNPKELNPDDVCGKHIGVQTGTSQEDQLREMTKECTAAGKPEINIASYGKQTDVTTNLAGGKIDAMFADSTVADYSVAMTNGQLEVIGGIRDSAPQGIVVDKSDEQLTEVVQEAMQKLIDDGTWNKILESWGVSTEAAVTTAELNPKVD